MTVEIDRDGEWVQVESGELTDLELCDCLSRIQIDSDEFLSEKEVMEGYIAIKEAIRRLEEKWEKENGHGGV